MIGGQFFTIPDNILKTLSHQEGNFLFNRHVFLPFFEVRFRQINQANGYIVCKITPVKQAKIIVFYQPEKFMKICPIHEVQI